MNDEILKAFTVITGKLSVRVWVWPDIALLSYRVHRLIWPRAPVMSLIHAEWQEIRTEIGQRNCDLITAYLARLCSGHRG